MLEGLRGSSFELEGGGGGLKGVPLELGRKLSGERV